MTHHHDFTLEDEFVLSGIDGMLVTVATLLACGATVADLGEAITAFVHPAGTTPLGQLIEVLEEAEQILLQRITIGGN